MIVYELKCVIKKSYISKTQRYFKVRTMEHAHNVWKVIASGRKKFGVDDGEAPEGTPALMRSLSILLTYVVTAETTTTLKRK